MGAACFERATARKLGQEGHEALARKELEALAPRIPFLVVQVTGAGAASARMTIDDEPVSDAALGVKRVVDPGRHVIRGEAPRFVPGQSRSASRVGSPGSEASRPDRTFDLRRLAPSRVFVHERDRAPERLGA